MQVLHDPCCGLDVHRKTITACLKKGNDKQVRQFRTTSERLRGLSRWLQEANCAYVAMESTGVYWKPVYNILELSGLSLAVVNARHIKAVPGRKTDVKDAEWICELARHGLVRGSRIPDRRQRELQELIRYRRNLINERTREINRVHKLLEGANIKLSSVVHDILGVSGRAMLGALARGETDPDAITAQVRTRLKATVEELREAVDGTVGDHQRFLLTTQLGRIDATSDKVAQLDVEVDARMRDSEPLILRLDAMPGVGRVTAQELLAAVGTDLSGFPTSGHLVSWAKVCPGANQSAGKHRPAGTGYGNPYIRATLVEAARAAVNAKHSYLRDKYYRLKRRRGANRAAIAVAHSILVIAYHIIKDGVEYREIDPGYLDRQRADVVKDQLLRRLRKMGYKITLEPAT